LRILQGYADAMPVQALELTTHTTGKSIRITYRALRTNLPLATQRCPERFAGVGIFLFDNGALSVPGKRLFPLIGNTRRFSRYVRRHAPRLRSDEDAQLLLMEKVVRIFCALDLRGCDVDDRLLAQITEAFTCLRVNEPLQKLAELIPKVRPHAHPSLRLYEDYRRYLLKHPL